LSLEVALGLSAGVLVKRRRRRVAARVIWSSSRDSLSRRARSPRNRSGCTN